MWLSLIIMRSLLGVWTSTEDKLTTSGLRQARRVCYGWRTFNGWRVSIEEITTSHCTEVASWQCAATDSIVKYGGEPPFRCVQAVMDDS